MATRFFLINNTFSTMSKLFAPNMYCWSCKILVALHWTHLKLNAIYAKSFCQPKTNNRMLFLFYGMLKAATLPHLKRVALSCVPVRALLRTHGLESTLMQRCAHGSAPVGALPWAQHALCASD